MTVLTADVQLWEAGGDLLSHDSQGLVTVSRSIMGCSRLRRRKCETTRMNKQKFTWKVVEEDERSPSR